MSGYASKAEYVDVLRQTIATDHNGLGYPRDPARFNIAGILRDSDFGGDRYYGYRPDYSCDLPEILRANYRPAHRANRRERPTSYVGRRRLETALASA